MSGHEDSLSVDNTLWSNTVVASGSVLGVVIYTGPETRAVMNTNQPASKVRFTKVTKINLYSPDLIPDKIQGNSSFISLEKGMFFNFQVGLLDKEVNAQTKVLFVAVLALSIVMMCLKVTSFY